jgi:hypothetical protein
MRKLPWLVLAASSVHAAPKKPLCVPGDTSAMTMFGSGGKAIACWEATGDCMSIDDNKAVARLAPPKPPAEVRDDNGKVSACNAKTCKPLGKKLAAAVAKARAQGDAAKKDGAQWSGEITVTTDLALVAIDAPSVHDDPAIVELWNLADDKALTPKKPAVYGKDKTPGLLSVQAVGGHAFATWSECGMPLCGKEIVVEPSGGNYSKAFDAGETYALDNGTYVVVDATGLTLLDSAGRHSGALDLSMSSGTDGSTPTGAVIGADEIVVLSAYTPDDSSRRYVHVKISGSKAKVVSKGEIPSCMQ